MVYFKRKRQDSVISKESGVSLIELLVSIGITAVLLLAIFQLFVVPNRMFYRMRDNLDTQSEVIGATEAITRLLRIAVSIGIRPNNQIFIMTNQPFSQIVFNSNQDNTIGNPLVAGDPDDPEFDIPPEFVIDPISGPIFRSSYALGPGGPGVTSTTKATVAAAPINGNFSGAGAGGNPSTPTQTFRVWLVDFHHATMGAGVAARCTSGGNPTGCIRICAVPSTEGNQSCFVGANWQTLPAGMTLGTFLNIEEVAFELVHSMCNHTPGLNANPSAPPATPLECRSQRPDGTQHTAFQPVLPSIDGYAQCFVPATAAGGNSTPGSLGDLCGSERFGKDFDFGGNENPLNHALSEMLVRVRVIGELRDSTGRIPLEVGAGAFGADQNKTRGARPFLQTAVFLRNWDNQDAILQTDVTGNHPPWF